MVWVLTLLEEGNRYGAVGGGNLTRLFLRGKWREVTPCDQQISAVVHDFFGDFATDIFLRRANDVRSNNK